MDYAETLPLVDKEVVLTFDDGPLPPYTDKILDILAAECVKATYFIVGDHGAGNPERCGASTTHGHTVGTHSMSHPIRFRALALRARKRAGRRRHCRDRGGAGRRNEACAVLPLPRLRTQPPVRPMRPRAA